MSVGSVAESVKGLSTFAATGPGGGAASIGSSATGLAAGLFTTASGAASSTKRRLACAILAGALGGPLAPTVVRIPATTATGGAAACSARLCVLTTPSVALMVVTPWAISTPKAVPCTV